MMHRYLILVLLIGTLQSNCNLPVKDNSGVVKSNYISNDTTFVPDETVAIKIAEAIWLPIYGDAVLKQKPYKVKLVNDSVWIVKGTLKHNLLGGVAYIEIRRKDGTILKVTHGK